MVTAPDAMEACRRRLESLPGVEVHHTDRPTGRMIAVLESPDLAGQEEALRRIQEVPGVRLAALVEHRIDPEDAADSAPTPAEGHLEREAAAAREAG